VTLIQRNSPNKTLPVNPSLLPLLVPSGRGPTSGNFSPIPFPPPLVEKAQGNFVRVLHLAQFGEDLTHCCDDLKAHLAANEVAITYSAKLREFGIRYLDGTSSVQTIQFCPWCGSSLPTSLCHDWFSALEEKNIDPWGSSVPEEFLSDTWWKSKY
jgi:hypothetical protein